MDDDRLVQCYCGKNKVVTRRPPDKDRYAVCSFDCHHKMVYDGKHEPGTLFKEIQNG